MAVLIYIIFASLAIINFFIDLLFGVFGRIDRSQLYKNGIIYLCNSSRLKYLPQAHPFRDVWGYNNLMYMIAGHVAEVIGGKSYETLIREKIWSPLQMTSSIFIDDIAARDEHFAYPYFEVNETLSFDDDDFLLYRYSISYHQSHFDFMVLISVVFSIF